MKKTIIHFVFPFILTFTNVLMADGDWDIYSDAVIEDGDDYWDVRVFDSPPDHTTVDMTGGSANVIQTYDASTFNMTGGITEVSAHDESTITMDGGTIYTLRADESSTADVFGGFTYSVGAYHTSTVNVTNNADIFSLSVYEFGLINMLDGTANKVGSLGYGTINLSGGLVSDGIWAGDSSVVNVYGYNLSKTASGGDYGYGFVVGDWENGTMFEIDFSGPDTYAHIILYEIPEPASILLLAIGMIGVRGR